VQADRSQPTNGPSTCESGCLIACRPIRAGANNINRTQPPRRYRGQIAIESLQ
jgi:hypothetical protein